MHYVQNQITMCRSWKKKWSNWHRTCSERHKIDWGKSGLWSANRAVTIVGLCLWYTKKAQKNAFTPTILYSSQKHRIKSLNFVQSPFYWADDVLTKFGGSALSTIIMSLKLYFKVISWKDFYTKKFKWTIKTNLSFKCPHKSVAILRYVDRCDDEFAGLGLSALLHLRQPISSFLEQLD